MLEISHESISRHLALMFYKVILYHILYLTLLVSCNLLRSNPSYVHLTKIVLVYLLNLGIVTHKHESQVPGLLLVPQAFGSQSS